jgi:phosphoglycolate phosphatase-like HAD superfamily hydrolase
MKELKRKKIKIAIASLRRPKSNFVETLRKFGLIELTDIFSCYADLSNTPSPGEERKLMEIKTTLYRKALQTAKVSPSRTLGIGDMVLDIIAGKKAGIKMIGVLTGYANSVKLKRAGAICVLKSVSSLPTKLRN